MRRITILLVALFATLQAFAWGQKGHDVTAAIAENHLTPRAAQTIDRVLAGHSAVYYSNWLDNASHRPAYAHTKTWHYINVDEGQTLESMPRNAKGDVLKAVEELVRDLKKGGLSAVEEAEKLKMLIHLVGDMHCPMHAGHLSDLGGNRIVVLFFDKATNLHSVWDSDIVEAAHRWSYTEWQHQIDRQSDDEVAALTAGTPEEWVRETLEICTGIYALTPAGTKISYDYIAEAAPVVERQLLRGGLRLARLLNEIYD